MRLNYSKIKSHNRVQEVQWCYINSLLQKQNFPNRPKINNKNLKILKGNGKEQQTPEWEWCFDLLNQYRQNLTKHEERSNQDICTSQEEGNILMNHA